MTNEPCRRIFTRTLMELAQKDQDIVALATDSRGSVTLGDFAAELPNQFVEIGIAEQNAVGVAAGLTLMGKKAFVCSPACFLSMRSIEQVKVDVAYSNAPVKLIGVSGGVSYGALGSTHHSVQDLAVMQAIPNLTILLPSDNYQTEMLTRLLVDFDQPVYMRMGRGPVAHVYTEPREFEIGKAATLREGTDLTLIGCGETTYHVAEAAKILQEKGIEARVLDMFTIKPMDQAAVVKAAQETGAILTVEEHSIYGGLGATVAKITASECPVPVFSMGIPDENAVTGSSAEVFKHYGITASGIADKALSLLERKGA